MYLLKNASSLQVNSLSSWLLYLIQGSGSSFGFQTASTVNSSLLEKPIHLDPTFGNALFLSSDVNVVMVSYSPGLLALSRLIESIHI